MNLFPKKKPSRLFDSEDEEHVWEDLPPPPSFDAEDDWSQESRRTSLLEREDEAEDGEGEVVRLKVKPLDGAVKRLEMQPISQAPPDARLSADDLRVEDFPNHDSQMSPYDIKAGDHGSPRWVFYAGLIVMAALIGALALFTMLNTRNPKVNPIGVPPMVIDQEVEYPMGEHIADLLARKDEAIDLFGRFLQAKSSEELLGMVRPVPHIEVLVRDHHRFSDPPSDWRIPADAKWDVHTEQQPVFGVLSGCFPDDTKFQAFMTLDDGRLLVDWKATVGYGTMPFSRLGKGEGNASEIRVWVEPATFYSAAFPEADYLSYRIHTSLYDPPVWAFARKGTVPERELARIFHKSMFGGEITKASMMVLALDRGPANAAPNQWMITDLLHNAWVLP
jgi:hypothetical protein